MKNNPWDEIEDSTNKIDFNAIIADKESVLDFYWAKDYYGQLLFILHTNSDIIINEKIPKLNGLTINVGSLKEKKQLVLTLQDISNADLFYIICSDLINTTKQLNDELIAIKKILKRLSQWQYFLKNNNKQIDKNQLKGLIGELHLFKKLLTNFSIDELDDLITQAEEESMITCEQCGKLGKTKDIGGRWYMTLCDMCFKKIKKERSLM